VLVGRTPLELGLALVGFLPRNIEVPTPLHAMPKKLFKGLLLLRLEARGKDAVVPGPESVGRFNVPDQLRPSY